MTWVIVKVLISAIIIAAVSEVAQRSSVLGAVLASIPLVSVLGMIWLYVDTGDSLKVADLAGDIVWLVIPSLLLFVVLPPLLRAGWNFWVSLSTSVALTICAYGVMLWLLKMWPVWMHTKR